jgi:glucose/arabinose dehydrogenase
MYPFLRTLSVATALVTVSGLAAYKSDESAPSNAEKTSFGVIPATDIKMPAGFSATILAEDLETPRHIAISKGGDIYVKINKLKDGKAIYRLRDTNGDGVIDEKIGFGDYKGSGIFIRGGYLYASSYTGVYRYKLNEKEEIIDVNNPEQIVKGLVTRGRDEAKNIAVDNNGYVYVNLGSYAVSVVGLGWRNLAFQDKPIESAIRRWNSLCNGFEKRGRVRLEQRY